jgi:hypothetical protein
VLDAKLVYHLVLLPYDRYLAVWCGARSLKSFVFNFTFGDGVTGFAPYHTIGAGTVILQTSSNEWRTTS